MSSIKPFWTIALDNCFGNLWGKHIRFVSRSYLFKVRENGRFRLVLQNHLNTNTTEQRSNDPLVVLGAELEYLLGCFVGVEKAMEVGKEYLHMTTAAEKLGYLYCR